LQRRFRIGYARAARLLDLLEAKGVVGPGEGAKPRKILISRTDLEDVIDQESMEKEDKELEQKEV